MVLLLIPSSGFCESEADRARTAYALSKELMSPFCPGRTLADCPSPSALAVREEIREKVEAGVAIEAIRRELEERFGSAVRATPRGPLGWLIPTGVLMLGAGGLGFALSRLLRRDRVPREDRLPPDLVREADEEFRRRGL